MPLCHTLDFPPRGSVWETDDEPVESVSQIDGGFRVSQAGPRRLWDRVEEARLRGRVERGLSDLDSAWTRVRPSVRLAA